jgi:hypothetical protein
MGLALGWILRNDLSNGTSKCTVQYIQGNYHSTQRKIPKEHRSHLGHDVSLKHAIHKRKPESLIPKHTVFLRFRWQLKS